MAFSEDLTAFFRTEDFADDAVVGTDTINGIFDHAYVNELETEGERPAFYCRTSDCSDNSIGQGTTVTVNDTTYTVASRQDDGTGVTLLILHES